MLQTRTDLESRPDVVKAIGDSYREFASRWAMYAATSGDIKFDPQGVGSAEFIKLSDHDEIIMVGELYRAMQFCAQSGALTQRMYLLTQDKKIDRTKIVDLIKAMASFDQNIDYGKVHEKHMQETIDKYFQGHFAGDVYWVVEAGKPLGPGDLATLKQNSGHYKQLSIALFNTPVQGSERMNELLTQLAVYITEPAYMQVLTAMEFGELYRPKNVNARVLMPALP